MIMKKNPTIRLSFWLPFSIFLAFTLMLISFSIQQYKDFHFNLEKTTLVSIKEMLTNEANRIERLYDNDLDNLVQLEIADLNLRNDVQTIALVDENATLIYGTHVNWVGNSIKKYLNVFDKTIFRKTQQQNRQQIEFSKDRNHIYVYEPILFPIKKGQIRSNHIGVIFADFNLTQIKSANIYSLFKRTYFAWGIGLILILILYFSLNRWLTIPFHKLISVINQFADGEYEARISFSGKGEFVEIGNAFNHMAQEVTTHRDQMKIMLEQEKKLKIELIAAKEKAEESDKLKSAFLANMSHEIRTPMNGILGFANLLKEPDLTTQEHEKFVDIIETSGLRMLNIINNIIDISKVEAGLMKVITEESNINEQIEFIYAFFKPEVEKKGMQFSYKNVLSQKEAIVKTDHEKLYAILINLVKNAIKYSKNGSIEFGYTLKNTDNDSVLLSTSVLEFYVKDTGMGIPKNRQEAVFERFIQADITDKMAIQGAGLGLAIAKAYVEMLNGRMWLESEEGKGSIFYFAIPYITVNDENINKENDMNHCTNCNVKNLKILIAEDDETSEMLLSVFVKPFVHEILKVKTGKDAVTVCRNNPNLDLVLMDIKMPEMNGYEATKNIRQFNRDVIIIAQTAFGLTGDREKALVVGANDYLPKPIKQNELIALLEKYFGGKNINTP
jgi:signal transduction histidine kinase/ActR/RegA family two-component response regulator